MGMMTGTVRDVSECAWCLRMMSGEMADAEAVDAFR